MTYLKTNNKDGNEEKNCIDSMNSFHGRQQHHHKKRQQRSRFEVSNGSPSFSIHKNALITMMLLFLSLVSRPVLANAAVGAEAKAETEAKEKARLAKLSEALKKRKEEDSNEEVASTSNGPIMSERARSVQESYVDLHGSDLDLGNVDPREAAKRVMSKIGASVEDHMAELFEKAKTEECRALIGEHFGHFVNAIGQESGLPFADSWFQNECDEPKPDLDNLPDGQHFGHIQLRKYQPPRNETEYIDDPKNLKLCFGIMTHANPASTIRLIETLYEPGYVFVLHVDGKEQSEETYNELVSYASKHPDHVYIVPNKNRVRVNWGGFSMVNATLQILRHAFALDDPMRAPLSFHKFVHIASTSYPVASNTEIRRTIASYPLDANMLNVIMKPIDPWGGHWNYFVECDDAVHRIYRLVPLLEKKGKGIDIYTSSQWFIASREFAKYMADAVPGSFVHGLIEYMKHSVIADESFFGTLLRHSPFCRKHHNSNFLHLHFDRWENEEENEKRDGRKCLFKDKNHCGRSPTTLTMDFLHDMELSDILFARKFDDDPDSEIKAALDEKRTHDEEQYKSIDSDEIKPPELHLSFEDHGVLIVAKDTVTDSIPLCLGLGQKGNEVGLAPCFHEWVPSTLAPGWESGAVIFEETFATNQWKIGPCSSDGHLGRNDTTGEIDVTPGNHTPTGPACVVEQMHGPAMGRCLDSDSFREQPGGTLHVNPCLKRYQQFFSFGDGSLTPSRTINHILPEYLIKRFELKGHTQERNMCIGVAGRGDNDPEEWSKNGEDDDEEDSSDDNEEEEEELNFEQKEMDAIAATHLEEDKSIQKQHGASADKFKPLRNFMWEPLVTTPCSNTGGVIEWLFVPYIVEEEDTTDSEETPDAKNTNNVQFDEKTVEATVSDGTCEEGHCKNPFL